MPERNNIINTLYLCGLLLVNIAPLAVVQFTPVSWHDVYYFYWAECAMFGVLIFFAYAKHLFVFFFLLTFVALIVSLLEEHLWGDMRIPATFWCLYSLYWLAYFELKNTRVGTRIHRLHPIQQFFIYLCALTIGIASCFALTATIFNGWSLVPEIPAHAYHVFLMMAVAVPTLTIGMLKIIHMIGARHFLHFLFGTYHRPVEKSRVVLFMDMVDSSKIAEKLEPKESMLLISRFIFDASAMIRKHGGDILNYTGDGLVVVWPLSKADRALGAVFAMRRRFEKIRPLYQKEFGIKPYFRMGLHAGKVVIAQIGEEKLFIGLYGDTVNTSSRLEEMNKKLDTNVLISGTVKQWLSKKWIDRLEPMGSKSIRGREGKIDVYTLRITD